MIQDDYALLEMMIVDGAAADGVYKPGPYWKVKTKTAYRQIKEYGLVDFRGTSNLIGQSFSDHVFIDVSTSGTLKGRVASLVLNKTPYLSQVFANQVILTRAYWDVYRRNRNLVWSNSFRVKDLLDRYKVNDSINAGCIDTLEIEGITVSAYYLTVLDTHDYLAQHVDYGIGSTLLEIGGGFGAYLHLLVSNYPNLRKFLYLDMAPNLYVGTQYLRSLYGDSVQTYRETRGMHTIKFRDDSDLEIICIAPYQLQTFQGSVDFVHNAHSFVEMPRDAVANYARLSEGILKKGGSITLVSYDPYDQKTINPHDLPGFFRSQFTSTVKETFTQGTSNFHFVGVGG